MAVSSCVAWWPSGGAAACFTFYWDNRQCARKCLRNQLCKTTKKNVFIERSGAGGRIPMDQHVSTQQCSRAPPYKSSKHFILYQSLAYNSLVYILGNPQQNVWTTSHLQWKLWVFIRISCSSNKYDFYRDSCKIFINWKTLYISYKLN